MQCALTLIIPFGETDPAEALTQDHIELEIGVEDAALIIAQYTEDKGIGFVPFLTPSPAVHVIADHSQPQPEAKLVEAEDLASSIEDMIAAWPSITMNAFNVATKGKPLVVEDGDAVVKEVGPNLDQFAEGTLTAKEFLRIDLQIDSERDRVIASSQYPGDYDLWDTVWHPDGGLGLVVMSENTDDLVILPVFIQCTSFMPSMAA